MTELQADPAAAEGAIGARPSPSAGALFLGFLRLGLTAFGGPAMIAQVKDLVVRRRGWLDEPTFDDGIVLAQSLPGATVIQLAAYVGLRVRGTRGAVAAYVGFGLPAFLLMVALSAWYARANGVPAALAVMGGLQLVVVALVVHAAWTFGRPSLRSAGAFAIAGGATALYVLEVSPFAVVAASAAAGLAVFRTAPAARAAAPAHPVRASWGRWAAFAAVLAAGLAAVRLVDPRLFELSLLMLRVNLFAFGGGFAALPLMLREVVDEQRWMTARTFMDGIALGQVTPGPISITATFVGYHLSGLLGAVVATVAMFTPSWVVLILAAPRFERIRASARYASASRGIAAGFVGLLAVTAYRFAQGIPWSAATVALAVAALAALLRRVDVLYVVLAAIGLTLLSR